MSSRRKKTGSNDAAEGNARRPLGGRSTRAAPTGTVDGAVAGDADDRRPAPSRTGGPDVRFEGVGIVGGLVLLIVAGAVLIAAIIQNTADVAFELFWFDVEAPLVVFLLGAALFAVIVDEVVGLVWRRRRREVRQLRERAADGTREPAS